MNGVKRIFQPFSIQTKLTVLIFLCALIPLAALGFLSYQKSADIVNDQFRNYNRYAMEQLKLLLDTHLREMDSIAREVLGYLLVPSRDIRMEPRNYREYLERESFQDFLNFNLSPLVEGLFVITPEDTVYGNRGLDLVLLKNQPWWEEAESSGWRWVGFHEGPYYSYSAFPRFLISLVVPVQLEAGLPKGSVILVDVDAEPIMTLFHRFEQDTRSRLEIVDAEGRLLYRSDGDRDEAGDAGPGEDLVWTETLGINGWTIRSRVPYEEYRRSSEAIRRYALLVGAAALVATFLLARLVSRQWARRIIRLNKSMLDVSQGKLDTRIEVEGRDELGRLAARFNFMTEQIRTLVQDISRTEKLRTEAERRALHYQINPHLILNTLNSIQWQARLAKQKEIDRMIYHLTEVLSENLDIRQELVPLQKELETVHHFLQIQKYRYGEVFRYEEQVEPEMLGALIPRISLQPLFENIFYHAFEDGKGRIRLKAFHQGRRAILHLVDDGAGFSVTPDGERIGPARPGKGRGGLGLYNVDQKWKLHFGDAGELRIRSEPGKGTEIEMIWPWMKGEEIREGQREKKSADRG